ncbi:MAG: ATP-binding cassette domain-containing protein [Candidatus Margulisiibacteriota bacterium]
MIKLIGITKEFSGKKVLDNINLEIPGGQKLAVIGPSGCGKSTLLRLLTRLTRVTKGAIFLGNKDITLLDEDALIKIRKTIGFVFQTSALFDSLSVYENVAFGLRQQGGLLESQISKIVAERLAMVDLYGTEALMPSELSGGMQKRVGLARAIATDPGIILYDEPTTGLDPVTSTVIEDLINKLAKQFKAISILVTHQMTTVYRTCDRVIMLHDGKFIETGNVQQTLNTDDPVVKNFIKGGLL